MPSEFVVACVDYSVAFVATGWTGGILLVGVPDTRRRSFVGYDGVEGATDGVYVGRFWYSNGYAKHAGGIWAYFLGFIGRAIGERRDGYNFVLDELSLCSSCARDVGGCESIACCSTGWGRVASMWYVFDGVGESGRFFSTTCLGVGFDSDCCGEFVASFGQA